MERQIKNVTELLKDERSSKDMHLWGQSEKWIEHAMVCIKCGLKIPISVSTRKLPIYGCTQ